MTTMFGLPPAADAALGAAGCAGVCARAAETSDPAATAAPPARSMDRRASRPRSPAVPGLVVPGLFVSVMVVSFVLCPLGPHDATKADMAHSGVDHLCVSRRRAVAPAVVWRT